MQNLTANPPENRYHLTSSPRTRAAAVVLTLLLGALLLLLAGCSPSGAPLSNVSASPDEIVPGSHGIGKPAGAVEVHYTLGSEVPVTVTLNGPARSTLLNTVQGAGDHLLRFNGIIDTAEPANGYTVVRRAVPSGDYTLTVSAGGAQQSVPFRVTASGQSMTPPTINNLVIHPSTISPNSDAVDDVAEATFRTTETTTVSVDLLDPTGARTQVLAPEKKGPGEQNVAITGQTALGEALPDGVYTATIRAEDAIGNRVEASRPLTITAGGQPDIEILSVDISPTQIIAGGEISVTIRIRNSGKVPLRTQGPDPGYTYTTNDTYASIEGNRWIDRAGLWRVGVDWDGNSGGAGPYRYPFRWGFGKTLMPGEEVVTGGKIRILKQERTMWFYAGVLQEGIRIVLDRLGRTQVNVDF